MRRVGGAATMITAVRQRCRRHDCGGVLAVPPPWRCQVGGAAVEVVTGAGGGGRCHVKWWYFSVRETKRSEEKRIETLCCSSSRHFCST